MSSPPVSTSTPQDAWGAEPPNESNNVHIKESHENPTRHENGDQGNNASELENPGPLLPSKTAGGPDLGIPGAKPGTIYREKQIKPNKVYVGGLPEHTRQEDLQSCFGKIGRIASIELKVGFGFVEFVDRGAAEESVAKYNEGYFMGNKIRVELSHGGGRTAKFPGEPGACFKCGQMGHWARECPNHVVTIGHRKPEHTLLDRLSHPPRDYPPQLPTRGYSPYRDDDRAAPVKETRYGYDYAPLPPSRDARDYRPRDVRPLSPPRDYRDYPVGPPLRAPREADDYRRDYRGHPLRYENRSGYYPDADYHSRHNYMPPPPPRDSYESRGGYDKRMSGLSASSDRYPPYPPPPAGGGRPRTPPRGRDEYEKPMPPRDYPPISDYRGRPATPLSSRYSDSGRSGPIEGTGSSGRYRRRSQSPIPRSGLSYSSGPPPPPSYSGGPPYSSSGNSSSGNFPGGYSGVPPQGRPPNVSGGSRDRDYSSRSGRDPGDSVPYVRRP